ncbi:MAG: phosphoribosylformylglycinamidine synthase [Chloroflexi bacterium]|nr:phosphoribosylformylglycinamidine synthase [Chloroflexota bacterium]MQG19371.1 phosphoribosylformylglycinamidine synthase subunit PurS [SAR202 cluster bacterium]
MILAKVYIQPKTTVKDPQGNTIKSGLQDLGFTDVEKVNMGKYLEIKLNTQNKKLASEQIKKMCDQMLTNPLIEDYNFVIEKI